MLDSPNTFVFVVVGACPADLQPEQVGMLAAEFTTSFAALPHVRGSFILASAIAPQDVMAKVQAALPPARTASGLHLDPH